MNTSKIEQHKLSSDNICSICTKFLPQHQVVTIINNMTICSDCEPDLMTSIRTFEKSRTTNLKHIIKHIAKKKNSLANRYIHDVPNRLWHEIKAIAAEQKKSHREIAILALQKYLYQQHKEKKSCL